MKKIVFLAACFIMIFPLVVNAAFTDVEPGHWAESYINELSEKGIINGMGDGTFAPNNTLTKGQFLKLIISASLPDVDLSKAKEKFEHWAAGYVTVAENYDVIEKGSIDASNIDEPISRLEVVKILSMCDINIRLNIQETIGSLPFNDVGTLSSSEVLLLKHAVAKEVINGYSDGSFKPNNNLTRAEASKILSIYMSK